MEIKFRAWDGEASKMHYWTLNDLLCRFGNKKYENDHTASPFFEWMQFSGLLDRNGKEVYEGDICKKYNSIDRDDFSTIEIHSGDALRGVTLIRRNKIEILVLNEDWDKYKFEVIGNVYENKELLKTTK